MTEAPGKRCIWFRFGGEAHSRCVCCGRPRDIDAGPCPGPPKFAQAPEPAPATAQEPTR